MPFLNSFMDLPSERAISGSLLPPNMTSTITRMTSSSCVPSPNMVRSSSVAETSGQRGDAQSRGGARHVRGRQHRRQQRDEDEGGGDKTSHGPMLRPWLRLVKLAHDVS